MRLIYGERLMGKGISTIENGCCEHRLFVFISLGLFVTLASVHIPLQIKEQVQEDVQGRFKHLGIS